MSLSDQPNRWSEELHLHKANPQFCGLVELISGDTELNKFEQMESYFDLSETLRNQRAMASNLLAMASNLLAMASNLLEMAPNLLAMAANLLAMAPNPLAALC